MSNMEEGSTRNPLRQWITRLVDRLHAAEDARARLRGWDVTRGPRFSRDYRDPRWNLVRACAECAGLPGAAVCPTCRGRGTIRLNGIASNERGER